MNLKEYRRLLGYWRKPSIRAIRHVYKSAVKRPSVPLRRVHVQRLSLARDTRPLYEREMIPTEPR